MGVQDKLALVTTFVETLLVCGVVFGWSAIEPVFIELGYFKEVVSTASPPLSANSMTSNSTGPQVEKLSLVFAVSSGSPALFVLFFGYVLDRYGGWVTRGAFVTSLSLGFLLVAVSGVSTSWLLFPAMTLLAVSGNVILMSNIPVANLFPRHHALVVALISGAFDSSTAVFLLVQTLYNAGVDFNAMFYLLASLGALMHARTFLLMPKDTIPRRLPVEFEYGYKELPCSGTEVKLSAKQSYTDKFAHHDDHDEHDDDHDDTSTLVESKDHMKTTATFSDHLRDPLTWTNVVHYVILTFRITTFVGSFNQFNKFISEDTGGGDAQLALFFSLMLSVSGAFSPLCGLLIDACERMYERTLPQNIAALKANNVAFVVTDLLTVAFSVLVMVPAVEVQYASVCLHVLSRAFLFSVTPSFVTVYFPSRFFGRLFALPITVAGVALLLQYPLTVLLQQVLGNDFTIVNAVLLFLSLLALVHPIVLHRRIKQLEAEANSSSDASSSG